MKYCKDIDYMLFCTIFKLFLYKNYEVSKVCVLFSDFSQILSKIFVYFYNFGGFVLLTKICFWNYLITREPAADISKSLSKH